MATAAPKRSCPSWPMFTRPAFAETTVPKATRSNGPATPRVSPQRPGRLTLPSRRALRTGRQSPPVASTKVPAISKAMTMLSAYRTSHSVPRIRDQVLEVGATSVMPVLIRSSRPSKDQDSQGLPHSETFHRRPGLLEAQQFDQRGPVSPPTHLR